MANGANQIKKSVRADLRKPGCPLPDYLKKKLKISAFNPVDAERPP